ncbi:MAG: ArnT family glycosyltransferase [bacterium]
MTLANSPGVRKYSQKDNVLDRIKPAPALWLLGVTGLALRLFFLRYRFAVAFDEVNYLKLGVSGALHGWSGILHTYWSPLLPAFIKLFCGWFPDYELGARMVSVLAGVLVLIPVYFLAKTVYDQKIGVIAAGFMAIFPPIAFRNTQILTESLVMLLGALAVLFGLMMLRRYSVGYACFAGLFAGLAYLAHPLALGFLAVLAGWILFGSFSRLFPIRRLRLVYLVPALVAGFVAVAAPYLVFLEQSTGTWTLSAKGAANQQMSTPLKGQESSFRSLDVSNTTVPIDQVFHQGTFLQATNGGAKPVRQVKLGPFVVKVMKNLADMMSRAIPQFLTTLPMLAFAVGLLGTMWQVQQGKMLLYLVSFLAFFWLILIPVFHIHLRYLSPVWPICAIFIAKGIIHIHGWLSRYMPVTRLSRRKKLNASALAGALVLVIFTGLSFLPEFGRVVSRAPNSPDYAADAVEQKRAGEWLKQHTSTTPVIMSRNHAVDFYAGNYDIKESVTIPTNRVERVLTYARHRNVTHLVLNERYVQDYPQLAFLLSGEGSSPYLELVYKDVDEAGLATVIYRLTEPAKSSGTGAVDDEISNL